MWQRVQTLYLILAIVCVFLALFFPLIKLSAEGNELIVTAYTAQISEQGTVTESNTLPLYFFYILTGLLSAAGIFLFKNRKLQLRIGRLNLLLSILFVGFLLFFSFWGIDLAANLQGKEIPNEVDISTSVGLGFFFTVAIPPFIFLANLGVKRDEKLVRSLDRLR